MFCNHEELDGDRLRHTVLALTYVENGDLSKPLRACTLLNTIVLFLGDAYNFATPYNAGSDGSYKSA